MQSWQKKSQNENSRRKRKNEKKRTKKHRDRKLHFSKQTEEREKQRILTKESVIKLVLSQTRSFEEEERGQREASSFS